MSPDDIWRIAILLVVVLLNGYFVAAEYALVSARRTRIQELEDGGSRRAGSVRSAIDDITRYVSATQVGVTVSSLVIGALGEPTFERIIDSFGLDGIIGHEASKLLAVVLALFIITYLHVVFGELVPKTYALQRSERAAMATIGPLRIFATVMKPLVAMLNESAKLVLRMLGMQPQVGHHVIHSEEELKMLVSQSSRGGVLEDTEQEMLYNVFDFADTTVAEVMVPRPDVVALAIDLPPAELMHKIIEQPYTRYPVFRGSMDDIVGILHIRDLFRAAERGGKASIQVTSLLRPAHIVPESKSLAGLLADFRRSKSHMALVVDEYGSLSGIVTLEDLLEEIVGEIDDEHDVTETPLERISENHFRVDGKFSIDELNERFGLEIPTDDFNTIGGFVFGILGQQPHEGDVVRWGHLRLEVVETDGPRIVHVDVILLEGQGDTAGDARGGREGRGNGSGGEQADAPGTEGRSGRDGTDADRSRGIPSDAADLPH